MDPIDHPVQVDLLAYLVGEAVLEYLCTEDRMRELLAKTETPALKMLEQIRQALNNKSLDDLSCYRSIEAILRAYEDHYCYVERHIP